MAQIVVSGSGIASRGRGIIIPGEAPPLPGSAIFVTTQPIANDSASLQTNQPIVFGLGFAQGAVQAGWRLRLEMPDETPIVTQVDDRTRWPDGSLKHCRVSCFVPSIDGLSTMDLRVVREQAAFNNAGSGTIGDILANPDNDLNVRLTNLVASAGLVSTGSGTWQGDLFDALTTGRVKKIGSGPVCDEWEAVAPFKDVVNGTAHETLEHRWYVRLWASGALQYVCLVEQTKMFTPNDKMTYDAVLRVGSTIIHDYGTVDAHYEHSGWFTVDEAGEMRWRGISKPPLRMLVNREYWRVTGLIPSFDLSVTPNPADDASVLSYTPMWRHDLRRAFDTAGASDFQIGLCTGWFSHAFLSNGKNYWRRSRINSLSYAHMPCSWRNDAVNMEVPHFLPYTSSAEGDWSVLGAGLINTYAGSGYNSSYDRSSDIKIHNKDLSPAWEPQFDSSHFPSLPYWHYLFEGHRYWLDLLHLSGTWHTLQYRQRRVSVGGTTYDGILSLMIQSRESAWALREILLAAAITPTEVVDTANDAVPAIGAYFRALREENMAFAAARIADEFAGIEHMGLWNDSKTGTYVLVSWQHDFIIQAIAQGYLASGHQGLKDFLYHIIKWRIGLFDETKGHPYFASAYKHSCRLHFETTEWVDDFSKVMCAELVSSISFNPATSEVTIVHGFSDLLTEGSPVQFSKNSGSAVMPTGLTYAATYYIRDLVIGSGTATFRLSTTPDGSNLATFSDTGSGSKYMSVHFERGRSGFVGDYDHGYAAIARGACVLAANAGVAEARTVFDYIEANRGPDWNFPKQTRFAWVPL